MAFLTGTNLFSLLLLAAAFFFLSAGVRALRLGRKTIYFRHRRQRVLAGWWMTGAGLLLVAVAALVFRPKNPFFAPAPASSTPVQIASLAPSTPSRTATPSPRPSRSVTFTPSPTATPHLPLALEIMVVSSVTPQASASITDIRFSDALDAGVYPIGNRFEWINPLSRMYASYVYSHMTYGAQFTVLWFRNGELVSQESGPWKAGGHGRASSMWWPAPQEWHSGVYEVQFFVGTEWKATGHFTVKGEPPPPTFTPSPTLTLTPSPTWTSSPVPSNTPTLTVTPSVTPSHEPSATPAK